MNKKLRHCTLQAAAFFAITLISACSTVKSGPSPQQAYGSKPSYNYPITNPYAATIITVPQEMKVDYSSVPEPSWKTITLYKDRVIPEGFWYQNGLKYGELLQKKPAALVYIIPGTGADSQASIMRTLADILYTAGYSIVLLPSPTNPNFIINASENFLPGNPAQDASDLYHLMQAIDSDVARKATVTGHMLMGYSLGAWQAAYTAKLDSERGAMNFRKVLLINPPLSLYSSMETLDNDLNRALPHGMDDADSFIKSVITRLSRVSAGNEAFDFQNENLLLDAYNKYHPSDDRMATTIGLSFRLSAADMVFTSDVMRHSNYIFPANESFTTSTSLNPYVGVALRTSFTDYLKDVFYKKQHAQNPAITEQDIINAGSLESIAPYILNNDKLGMITNRDDIILAPGELDKLVHLFDNRAVVFPTGGHLGNIAMPAMAWQIVTFMKQ